MITSEKTEQVCASLFAVQRDAGQPKKNARASGGRFSYEYLDLPGLIEFLKPHLERWSLFVTQEVRGHQGFAEVYTRVWHTSGQFMEFGPAEVPMRIANEPQDAGSATTYCRRYALAAVFNLAADADDDASGTNPPKGAGTGRGAPSQDPPSPPTPNVGAPEALGEGTEGAPTLDLWSDVLKKAQGKTKVAVELINAANGTRYANWQQAREEATPDELRKAAG